MDGRLAPALQSGLHRFAKPWYRLRALRVFRDETNLSATPELWPSIVEALDQSGWFILLASPEAANSVWVNDEVEHWRTTRSTKRIMVVVTRDDGEGNFDWEKTTAIPPALRLALAHEPRVVDVRWARDEVDISLHNARFRDAVADVAAPLHRKSKDEIHGEDVRQHRRTRWIVRGAVATLALFLAAALALAVIAVDQREEARAQRDRAEVQAHIALSRQLAAQSVIAARDRNLDLARLLALEAYRVEPTADARSSLLNALQASPRAWATLVGHVGGFVKSVAFTPDGTALASGGEDGSVRLWDVSSGTTLGQPLVPVSEETKALLAGREPDPRAPVGAQVMSLAFDGDGRLLAAGRFDGQIRFFDVERRRPVGRALQHGPGLVAIALSPDGRILASAVSDGSIRLWDIEERVPLGAPLDGSIATGGSEFEGPLPATIGFSPDGTTLAWTDVRGEIRLWDLMRGREAGRIPVDGAVLRVSGGFAFIQGGRMLAVAGDAGVELWDLRDLTRPDRRLGRGEVFEITANSGGGVLAGTTGDAVVTWDVRTGRMLARLPAVENRRPLLSPDGKMLSAIDGEVIRLWWATSEVPLATAVVRPVVSNVAFAPDGQRVTAIGADGSIIWDLARSPAAAEPLPEPLYPDPRSNAVAFSPDGRRLLASRNGAVRLFETASQRPLGRAIRHDGVKLGFTAGGRAVALVRSRSGRLTLWDVERTVPISRLPLRADGFALAPDGKTIAAGTVYKLELWDGERGRRLASGRRGEYQPQDPVFSPDTRLLADTGVAGLFLFTVPDLALRAQLPSAGAAGAFSRDGSTLAFAAADGHIRLWDVGGARLLGEELPGSGGVVLSLSYGPDGTLASVDEFGRVHLWDELLASTRFEPWRERLCAVTARNLTAREWQQFLPMQPHRITCPRLGAHL